MNIHEHQAKEILKDFGAPVSKGIVIFSKNEISEKINLLNSKEFFPLSICMCWIEPVLKLRRVLSRKL